MKPFKCFISSVEIVSPTVNKMITHDIERFKKFFDAFGNTMAQVALQYGHHEILPVPDSLKFIFPQRSNLTKTTITIVLDCFIDQLIRVQSLSMDMGSEGKIELLCRMCADYV